jgi:cell division protein FtsI (penicillin-binding protein 3)
VANEPMNKFQKTPDSSLYKFNGMSADANTILNVFDYKENINQVNAKWGMTVLQDGRAQLMPDNMSTAKNKVPDVTGLGLKDAVYLLENKGLKVLASGRGKVIYQSLTQNSDFNKGQSIKIELN